MTIDSSISPSDSRSHEYRVCSVCHRWYQADGAPWWRDDRCGECDEARRTRSEARAQPPTPTPADDEVPAEV